MKKNILSIVAVVAAVVLLVSVLLCFIGNVKLSSMGIKIEEKLALMGDDAGKLRNHNVLSFVGIFLSFEKLDTFIETFNAEKSFWFPMLTGTMILLCFSTLLRCIVFPIVAIFIAFNYFKKKTYSSVKALGLWCAFGGFSIMLPYALSLLILQKIYVTAFFKFTLFNIYLALAITAVVFIAAIAIIASIKTTDGYKVPIVYSERAYEEGGAKYDEVLALQAKKEADLAAKEAKKAEKEAKKSANPKA